MTITINGQLLLCMLSEWLLTVPTLRLIQCNTDGITFICNREYLEHARAVYKHWEKFTLLDLEEQEYSRMFIRDVNAYIAEKPNGKLKNKGAYAWKTRLEPNFHPDTHRDWHKDHGALIVPKAVEAYLIRGEDPRQFIINHQDPYDFMLLFKPGKDGKRIRLELGGEEIQQTSRYYVTIQGGEMYKFMPPTGPEGHYKKSPKADKAAYESWDNSIYNPDLHTQNKSQHTTRKTSIQAGWLVTECNDMKNFNRDIINYEFYIAETMKLIEAV